MGVAVVQRFGKRHPGAFGIAKHVMIPEPNHAIAFGFDHPGTPSIAFRPMLAAIDLDDETGAMTRKIGGERPDRNLEAEARLRKALAEEPPHRLLGIGRVGTKLTCSAGGAFGGAVSHV